MQSPDLLDPLSFDLSTVLSDAPASPPKPPLPKKYLLTPDPSSPDSYFLELDNSALELFTICQRKAQNKLILGREADRSASTLAFGTLFHKLEELRLRHGLSAAVEQEQEGLIRAYEISNPAGPGDHRTAARMRAVLAKYNALYSADGWPDSIVETNEGKLVERSFKIPLTTIDVGARIPFRKDQLISMSMDEAEEEQMRYTHEQRGFFVRHLHVLWTGRIDAVLTQGPYTFIVDHKTGSRDGIEPWFRLAHQTVGYTWATQKILGRTVHGCKINHVLMRPEAKTARATKPREEFNRYDYFYSPERIAEWEDSCRYLISDLVASLIRGFFPLSGPKSYDSPCVYCDYHDNCQLAPAQRPFDLASALYRDVTWNPITTEE